MARIKGVTPKSILKIIEEDFGNKQFSFKSLLSKLKNHFDEFVNSTIIAAILQKLVSQGKLEEIKKMEKYKLKKAEGSFKYTVAKLRVLGNLVLAANFNKVKFVVDNIDELDEYDLVEPFERILKNKIKKDTGFFPEIKRDDFKIPSIGLELKINTFKSYDALLKHVNEFSDNLGGNEAKEKYKFNMLMSSYVWGFDPDKKVFKLSEYGLNLLIDLLYYLITDKITANLAEANEIMDKNELKSSSDFRNLKLKGLPKGAKITMTKMKNGKIVMKGLSDEQWAAFERIYNYFNRH